MAPRQNCDLAADDSVGDYSEPYAVPLGSGPGADTQFIVFDSSVVGVLPLAASDPTYVTYRAQLERYASALPGRGGVFCSVSTRVRRTVPRAIESSR